MSEQRKKYTRTNPDTGKEEQRLEGDTIWVEVSNE